MEFVTDPTAVPETKGFVGERFDADSGLQYLNARYYDPKLAMFIQPDWFEVTRAGVGTNRYGSAIQSSSIPALIARSKVVAGNNIYRLGTTGISKTAEAQFWSLENPLTTKDYAQRYGIPAENLDRANFLITGKVPNGTSFVTRPAPGMGANMGGAIEVVVPPSRVEVLSYKTLGQ